MGASEQRAVDMSSTKSDGTVIRIQCMSVHARLHALASMACESGEIKIIATLSHQRWVP